MQVAAWQRLPVQTALAQSLPLPHISPVPQPPQVDPPQSMSVSSWFWTPSPQVGAWQRLPVQTPLEQSVPIAQSDPAGHEAQIVPPQSMSLSS